MNNTNIVSLFRWLLALFCFGSILLLTPLSVLAPNPTDVTCGAGGVLFEAAKSLFFSSNSKYHQIKTSTEQMINCYASKAADAKIAGNVKDSATSQRVVEVLFAYLDILKEIYPNVRRDYDQSLVKLSAKRKKRDQAKRNQERYRERPEEYNQVFKEYDVAKADMEWHEALMARIKKDRQFIKDTIDGRSNLNEMNFKIRSRNAKCDYKDAYNRLYNQKRTRWIDKTKAKIGRYENAKPLDSIRLLSSPTQENNLFMSDAVSSASSSSQSSPNYSVPSQSIRNSFKYRDTSYLYSNGSNGSEIEEIAKSTETVGGKVAMPRRTSIRTIKSEQTDCSSSADNKDQPKNAPVQSIRTINLATKNESVAKVTIGEPVHGIEQSTNMEHGGGSQKTPIFQSIRTTATRTGTREKDTLIIDADDQQIALVRMGVVNADDGNVISAGGSIRPNTQQDGSKFAKPSSLSGSSSSFGGSIRDSNASILPAVSIRKGPEGSIRVPEVKSGSIRNSAGEGTGKAHSTGSIRPTPSSTTVSGNLPSGSIRPSAIPSGSIRPAAGGNKLTHFGDNRIIDENEVTYEPAHDSFMTDGFSKKDDYSFRFQVHDDRGNETVIDDDIMKKFKNVNIANVETGTKKQESIRRIP